MTKSVLIAVLSYCLFTSLSCSRSQQSREYHSTRFPETRSINEAKLWLHWSRDERLAFVRGFVIGYKDGSFKGCRIALDAFDRYTPSVKVNSQLPDSSICFSENSRFDRTVDYYEDSVTSFYQMYPVDDDVPIRVLIEEFSDHKTPAEFHNSLRPREP
jgi:hypothetical protein